MLVRRQIALLALVVAGCGSSESDKTAPFVGPWTVTTGSLTGMCTGLPTPFTQKLDGGGQTITKTADGALSMTILPGCNIILDVAGNVATLRATMPPQSCTFQFMVMGTSLPVMATFSSGTFTVNGSTASFNYVGNAAAGILSCMVTGTGMSMKGAPPDAGGSAADAGAPADTGSPADTATADTATADTSTPADTGTPSDVPCAADGPPCTGSPTDGP